MCGRTWIDPLDSSYSRRYGGRWNAPGSFGVLYLCATSAVAAAVARVNFIGEIATLMDLLPDVLPDLLEVSVRPELFVDAVSEDGASELGLAKTYPYGVSWHKCRLIGARAYGEGERGIACRSAAEATATSWIGEELGLFDTQLSLVREKKRYVFDHWYERPHLE